VNLGHQYDVASQGAVEEEVVTHLHETSSHRYILLHPTKAQEGEKLPAGYARSYTGFVIRDLKREIKVDQDIIKQEMDFLSTFAVIEGFVGGKQQHVSNTIHLGKNLGRGFMIIKASNTNTIWELLLSSPHRTPAQTLCIPTLGGQLRSRCYSQYLRHGEKRRKGDDDTYVDYVATIPN
jgi:hypothetical protein